MISDNEPDQKIFSVEKSEGCTTIQEVEENKKASVVFELLGGSPADILYPANILVVEGPSEVEFINGITSRFYSNKPKLQVIPARGDCFLVTKLVELLQKIYDVINNPIYKERFVIFVDKQPDTAAGAVKDFLNKNSDLRKDKRYSELAFDSLEEYYPIPWKTIIIDRKASDKKITLAKKVAAEISKDQFEKEMNSIFDVLQIAWSKAYI